KSAANPCRFRSTVFRCCASAESTISSIRISLGRKAQGWEGQPHDGPHVGSLGVGHYRRQENSVDDGKARAVAAGRKAKTAVCGLQRYAQYWIGCSGGRDAAADSADSWAREC